MSRERRETPACTPGDLEAILARALVARGRRREADIGKRVGGVEHFEQRRGIVRKANEMHLSVSTLSSVR